MTGQETRLSLFTISSEQKQCRTEYYFVNAISVLLMIIFGFITIMSFVQTAVFDESVGIAFEEVLFVIDNIPLNLLITAAFFGVLLFLRRFYDFFAKVNLLLLEIILGVWAATLATVWVLSVTSMPDSDSMSLFEAATKAAANDFSPLYNGRDSFNSDFYHGHSYFHFYPFQLGFVLLSEGVYRVCGTENAIPMQLLNAICLGSAYFALARITQLTFKRRSITFFTVLLLAVCFQPMLMCTFAYGNIIGMTTAIWASLLLIKYLQTQQYRWILISAILLTIAVIIKYNHLIYLVAFGILLLIHAVKHKKWQSIAFALMMCVMCTGGVRLVILSYEIRANTKIESGLSQVMYHDLGLQESSMCSGWFTRTAIDDYEQGGYDTAKADAIAWQHIGAKYTEFITEPFYAFGFFSRKLLSQWIEPSYESIWVSQVKPFLHEPAAFVREIYSGTAGKLLQMHFNLYTQVLFLFFTAGITLRFLRRQATIETILLPLIVLGGIGYHLLFEAKSQYALTYIPLLIPSAAYGLHTLLFMVKLPHKKQLKA
ncbi:MAG: glycosyltransferase family 39 protein [Ruminococcus sp.]|nr:glycosyltransferase family 39 protein [Ruminococcus sp.]